MRGRLWWCVLLAGCSLVNDPGDHLQAGPDAGPQGVPFEQFCDRYAEAFCAAKARCCMTAEVDVAACSDQAAEDCTGIYGSAFGIPDVTYNPLLAAEALDSAQEILDACSIDIIDWGADRRGFLGGLEGEIEGGQPCQPMGDDDTSVFVAHLTCRDRDQICQRISPDEWRCGLKLSDGQSCRSGLVCMSNRCPREPLALNGTCGPGEAATSSCTSGEECASRFCTGRPLSPGQCVDLDPETIYCAPID